MPVAFPHPLYITFFTSHALIIIGVLYAVLAFAVFALLYLPWGIHAAMRRRPRDAEEERPA